MKAAMLTAREALDRILEAARPLSTISVSLDRALGAVPAADIVAQENVPSFDNAAMDGFAVRSVDVAKAPTLLKLSDEIAAGSPGSEILEPSSVIRIMTGAKVPDGADVVVQQEWTNESRPGFIEITKPVPAGHNIRKAGADIAMGSVAVHAGVRLRPQEIGVLASLGEQFVTVRRPPSVAVLVTGNELLELDKKVSPGKIRDSNSHLLSSLVRESGGEPVNLGIAKDDPADLKAKLAKGLDSDALITSGGVSVGKYDLVMETLRELGVEILFWKVKIKPGMPLLFGRKGSTLVWGLPGNPVSSMVTFVQFVRPAIYRMMGMAATEGVRIRVRLLTGLTKSDGKRHFVRGILERQDGVLTVRSTGSQISNILSSLVKANCLIILPEETERVSPGDEVEVELL
jgi:molybdopterin molybdotransferase